MSSPEEQQVALIPRNFMERGTFMGGMFKIRNAIEGAVLAGGIGIPPASTAPSHALLSCA